MRGEEVPGALPGGLIGRAAEHVRGHPGDELVGDDPVRRRLRRAAAGRTPQSVSRIRASARLPLACVRLVPRVTVCVPTYNRAESLRRAVGSVTRPDLPRPRVVLVSDNASTDDDARGGARAGGRRRASRSSAARSTSGSRATSTRCSPRRETEYVMVLADDDWLEPDYVEACVAALDADPGLVIASGGARQPRRRRQPGAGAAIDLLDERSGDARPALLRRGPGQRHDLRADAPQRARARAADAEPPGRRLAAVRPDGDAGPRAHRSRRPGSTGRRPGPAPATPAPCARWG